MKLNILGSNSKKLIYRGIFTAIAGVILVAVPNATLNSIIIILGGTILLSTIINIIDRFIKNKQQSVLDRLFDGSHFMRLAFGLALVIMPEFFSSFFVAMIGIALILIGILGLSVSVNYRKQFKSAIFFIIISLVIFMLGIVMFFNPFESTQIIVKIIGINFLIVAAAAIASGITLNKYQKNNPSQTIDTEGYTEKIIDAEIIED